MARRCAGHPVTGRPQSTRCHLEAAGFAEAPRALGIDERGREVLTYLAGDVLGWADWPEVMLAGDGVTQLGALLRRYHLAAAGFRPPDGARWRNPLAPATGEVVRHGDFSPFNTVWRDGRVVGVIDWDFAQPGDAISDLACLAWYAVPLAGDRRARMNGFAGGVDRAGRLRALCAAYGRFGAAEVVAETVRIIELERAQTAELAARGLEPWAAFARDGNLEAFAAEAAWIRQHTGLLLG